MTDCPHCHNQRTVEGQDGPEPCPACARRVPLNVIAGAMDAARAAADAAGKREPEERIACVDCEERYPEDALNSSNVCDDCMERRREDRDYASECEGHGAWLRRQQ